MGYNVYLEEANFVIPENDQVLSVLKELNDPKNNAVKRGGSYSLGYQQQWWYSWMPEDYDKTVTSAEAVFKLLGFECSATHLDDEPLSLDAQNDLRRVSKMEHETGSALPCSWPQCSLCMAARTDGYYNAFSLVEYDSKTGQEDLFIAAIAQFVRPGSYLQWRGEDNAQWRHKILADHSVRIEHAETVWPS